MSTDTPKGEADSRAKSYGTRNAYTCEKCSKVVITEDMEEGVTPLEGHDPKDVSTIGKQVAKIAMLTVDLSAARAETWEKAAKLVHDLPANKARCTVLQLTKPAWEEALEAAEIALRAEAEKEKEKAELAKTMATVGGKANG